MQLTLGNVIRAALIVTRLVQAIACGLGAAAVWLALFGGPLVARAEAPRADSSQMPARGSVSTPYRGTAVEPLARSDSTFATPDGGAGATRAGSLCPPGSEWGARHGVTDCVTRLEWCAQQSIEWSTSHSRLRCVVVDSIRYICGWVLGVGWTYCDYDIMGTRRVPNQATTQCRTTAPDPQYYPLPTYLTFRHDRSRVMQGDYTRLPSEPLALRDVIRGQSSITAACRSGAWVALDQPPVCADDPAVAPDSPCP